MPTKTCTKCREEKPLGEFPPMPHIRSDRRNARCRTCLAAISKEWKDKNKEKVALSHATWYRSERGRTYRTRDPRRSLLVAARSRAKQRGIPFSLTIDDIVVPKTCPVLGFTLRVHVGSRGGQPDSPSLDRIIPAQGYVPGNVMVMSHLANTMKGSATPEDLLAFARFIFRTYAEVQRVA